MSMVVLNSKLTKMFDNSPYLPIGIAKLKKHNIIDRVLPIARSAIVVGTKMSTNAEPMPVKNRQTMTISNPISGLRRMTELNNTRLYDMSSKFQNFAIVKWFIKIIEYQTYNVRFTDDTKCHLGNRERRQPATVLSCTIFQNSKYPSPWCQGFSKSY